eukprot:6179515-Pleurochrysis_carterae.AAC.4
MLNSRCAQSRTRARTRARARASPSCGGSHAAFACGRHVAQAKQLLWLLNSVELDLFDRLSGDVALAANAIFWAYILISYFVLLNLLVKGCACNA